MLAVVALFMLGDCNAEALDHFDYTGDLRGDLAIRMTLLDPRPGVPIQGTYFYTRHLQDIPLTGELTGPRSLALVEHDDQGRERGRFELEYAKRDPRGRLGGDDLGQEVLVGQWVGADRAKGLPVYLALASIVTFDPAAGRYAVAGATDDGLVERNARAFRKAVIAGDKRRAAELVAYPLRYQLAGSTRHARDTRAFLADYDALFTPALIDQVRAGVPHAMFANSDGIMLGDGVLWLDDQGRVFAINN